MTVFWTRGNAWVDGAGLAEQVYGVVKVRLLLRVLPVFRWAHLFSGVLLTVAVAEVRAAGLPDYPALRAELLAIRDNDQRYRLQIDVMQKAHGLHSPQLQALTTISGVEQALAPLLRSVPDR